MKRFAVIISVLIMCMIPGTISFAKDVPSGKKAKTQTVCPVLGDPVDRNVYVDYKGKRVYFCCASCKTDFAKDPEKYMKKMHDQGIEPESSPGK